MIEIFLDDVREPPRGFFGVICRTARSAIHLLSTGLVSYISFDHDLGTDLTGYDVAAYIEESVYTGSIPCPQYAIHSANPVGSERIHAAMTSAQRLQSERIQNETKRV